MRTVVIVDDHGAFRAAARAMLESDGFVVVGEAADGRTGISLAQTMAPDVVLVDIHLLGDTDGFAVCEAIAADADRFPDRAAPDVVLTSSHHASAFRRRLAASAAVGFLPKADLAPGALTILLDAAR
jgi:DNA-binding NarL/FixJ family response regulator